MSEGQAKEEAQAAAQEENAAMAGREGEAGVEREGEGEHVAKLGASQWGMWRGVGLRAAGFSVEGVGRLAAQEAAAAAERVMAAEGEAEARW